MKEHYKSPLTIYVVWHPNNANGIKYAEALYNSFCRDINSPLSRGLSIPVYFRSIPLKGTDLPIDIDTSQSDRNAIVLLADEEMFNDSKWNEYVTQLLNKESTNTRIFPIALSEYAFSIDEARLSKKQFINLTKINSQSEEDTVQQRIKELRSRLLHDLSRFFFKLSTVAEADYKTDDPPIKLFISHAKIDSEQMAMHFRDYVLSQTKLKTFFDVNDIADADDFEKSIEKSLGNSAIVVFLSDQYSTREWCRIEVIVAKRNKSPLVVVNNIENGEKRSFPYLGNVPSIRYKENCFPNIIDLALFQVLNNLFLEEKLKKEIALYNVEDSYLVYPIENAPELFTYVDIKRLEKKSSDKKILVIYPDPPLGKEELNVLNDIDDNIQFITPTLIYKLLGHGKQ